MQCQWNATTQDFRNSFLPNLSGRVNIELFCCLSVFFSFLSSYIQIFSQVTTKLWYHKDRLFNFGNLNDQYHVLKYSYVLQLTSRFVEQSFCTQYWNPVKSQTLCSTEVYLLLSVDLRTLFLHWFLILDIKHKHTSPEYNRAVPLRFTYGVPGVFGERGKGGVAKVNEA